MARWSVYILRCADGTLYTGIATDVRRRLAEHVRGGGRGAKYLRGRGPLRIVFARAVRTRGTALRLESRIKKLSKARKEALIAATPPPTRASPRPAARGTSRRARARQASPPAAG
ncbi:MAG TPA: GIY-YIG nuclease family protein [Candidatus Binatia bacterium]|nr:GIY-YIG nuclease family protein [Candidatus Binatia bacterium]